MQNRIEKRKSGRGRAAAAHVSRDRMNIGFVDNRAANNLAEKIRSVSATDDLSTLQLRDQHYWFLYRREKRRQQAIFKE